MYAELNAGSNSLQELLDLRIDRVNEVEVCVNTLLNTNLNVYIYGERGIGKTFLLNAIYSELNQRDSSTFPFFVHLFSLSHGNKDIADSDFYKMVTLELLSSIWKELFRHPVSSLMNTAIEKESNQVFRSEKEQYILELYRQLRYKSVKSMLSKDSNLGVSTIIKGNLGEKSQHDFEFDQIMSFELVKLIEEIRDFLLNREQKRKIIVLCDEANLMPVEWQKEIVTRHLDIFTNLSLQFVFVAGNVPGYNTVEIPYCFDYSLHLQGIDNKYIPDLIRKYFPNINLEVKESALRSLCSRCHGNPRRILAVINELVNEYIVNNKNNLSDKILPVGKRNVDKILTRHEKYINESVKHLLSD